jgi:hypothetical protein
MWPLRKGLHTTLYSSCPQKVPHRTETIWVPCLQQDFCFQNTPQLTSQDSWWTSLLQTQFFSCELKVEFIDCLCHFWSPPSTDTLGTLEVVWFIPLAFILFHDILPTAEVILTLSKYVRTGFFPGGTPWNSIPAPFNTKFLALCFGIII